MKIYDKDKNSNTNANTNTNTKNSKLPYFTMPWLIVQNCQKGDYLYGLL